MIDPFETEKIAMRIQALVLAAALAALPAAAIAQPQDDAQRRLEEQHLPRQQGYEADLRLRETQSLQREAQVRQQIAESERRLSDLELKMRTDENLRRMKETEENLRRIEDKRRQLVAHSPPPAAPPARR